MRNAPRVSAHRGQTIGRVDTAFPREVSRSIEPQLEASVAALASGARVMTNVVMKEAVEGAIERVREGSSLARALGATRAFPQLLVHPIASGEASEKLEKMLERRLAVFLTVLEPVMILATGGVVLLIVLAIPLPIIEINQLVH